MAFTAAFALPGGFKSDDGTPTLGRSYAFIIADTGGLLCACASTMILMYSGVPIFNIRVRMSLIANAVFFLSSSAKCLGAAFAFGLYAALAPVAHTTAAVAFILTTGVTLFDFFWFIFLLAVGELAMRNRLGDSRTALRMARYIGFVSLLTLWPYLVIGAMIAYPKIRGIH